MPENALGNIPASCRKREPGVKGLSVTSTHLIIKETRPATTLPMEYLFRAGRRFLFGSARIILALSMLAGLFHLGPVRADPAAPPSLPLSASDRAWLAAHPVIRLGVDANYPPYAFIDEQGKLQGVVNAFPAYLGPALNVRFEIIADRDWPQLARILSQALRTMPAAQSNAAFQKWIPLPVQEIQTLALPSPVAQLLPWLLGLIGVGLTAYFIGMLWNRQLKRELSRRQCELVASANRLQAAEAMAHIGNWQFTVTGGGMQLSDEIYRILGLEPQSQSFSHTGFIAYLHPDERAWYDAYQQRISRSQPGDTLPERYCRLVRANGEIRMVKVQVRVEYDPAGKPHTVFGVLQDVTDQKKHEEELKRLHTILHALVEGSTDVIFVKDSNGHYLVANQSLAALVGLPVAHILGADDSALFPAASATRFRADDLRIMQEGVTRTYEETVDTATTTHHYLTTKGPLVIDGEVRGVFGLCRDITGRKLAEAALQEREALLRLFIEHAPAALAMFDHEMCYLAVSTRWLSAFRLKRSDILGRSHYEVFPETPEHWKTIHRRGLSGEVTRTPEERVMHPDGTFQWLRWEVRPWHEPEGAVGGIVIFTEDITEHILAEQAMHESEARFIATFEQAAVGIAMLSPEGRWLRVNQKLCEIVGYAEPELLTLTFHDITHPDDLDMDLDHIRQILAHEIGHYTLIKRYCRKDGSLVWVNLTVALVWKPDATADYFVAVVEDITARKATETALHESETRFRHLFEQNPVPMLVYERGSLHMLAVNEAFLLHYGYSLGEAQALRLTDLYPDEEKQPITDLAAKLAGFASVGEWHHLKKDGSPITVEVRSHDLQYENRSARVAVITDITERKLIEKNLRDSEAHARLLLELAPFPAVLTRVRDGILLYGNHRAEIQYGISREHGIGQPAERFYEDAAQRARFLDPLQKTGKVDDLEVRMLTADGRPFWALVSASIVEFDHEPAIFTAINDITVRKHAEAALQEQEAFFRLIAENIGDMVAVLDLEGRRLYNSPSYQAVLGHPDALKGTDSFAEIHPDDRDRVRETFRETVRTGLGHRINYRFVLADGSVRHIESQGGVIRDEKGRVDKVVVVSRDVTERKQLEDEIRQFNTELETRVQQRTAELATANKELETFTYSVSHDLKAPLRGIDGYSRLLLEDYQERLDTAGCQLLNNVRHGVAQMNQLIEDLLAYSRMERRNLQGQPVDVSRLVAGVLDTLSSAIQTQGMEIEVSLQNLSAHADPEGLTIVLRNLIDNALKFSRDSDTPTLSINGINGKKSITLIIKDNGIGFDMQFHHRIFEIFQRLQRAEDYPGTGVGLAIAYKAMQRMGGRIWAESTPGEGATFYLELPR